MKVTLIGTGAYGLAIANCLAKNNHDIVMWTENKKLYDNYKKNGNVDLIFKDYVLPDNISITTDLEESLQNTKLIFLTCSSKYVEDVCLKIKSYVDDSTPICIAAKGIDEKSCLLMSQIVEKKLRSKNIAVISGPTFAIDLINNDPVALAIAGTNAKTRNMVQKALSSSSLKLRKSKDLIGTQICGSVKNIIAIASGILGGLGYSESTQAFLINESLHDIKKLIKYLGGKPKTILSYAGVGDLLMTSMSKKSRNYSFGYLLGSSSDKKEIDKFLETTTVEGYNTCKTVMKLLKKKSIDIPIIYLINDIIDGNKDAHELADFLINKD